MFISENFYYDSEIYNAKVYAVTDRPLYRPGEAPGPAEIVSRIYAYQGAGHSMSA